MLGLDYSAGRPRASEVKRLGYNFVIRYCGRPGTLKNATRAEVDDMNAHGVAVALVFETTAARAGEGFAAGVADAKAAVAHQAVLGIPASRPIYYAVDFDADPAKVEPYFRGVNSVPGPDSAYGGFRVVQRLKDDGLVVDTWQTAAWSRGQRDPRIDVFQRIGAVTVDGVACDVNETFTADFGQHPYQEDDMTPEQDRMLKVIYQQLVGAAADGGIPAPGQFGAWPPRVFSPEEVAKGLTLVDWTRYAATRPVADVDEAALAAELDARGIGGITAAELKDVLASIRLVPANTGGTTTP